MHMLHVNIMKKIKVIEPEEKITSNHYNKLDPALKRPGRIDISIKMYYKKYLNKDDFINKLLN